MKLKEEVIVDAKIVMVVVVSFFGGIIIAFIAKNS